MYDIYIWSYFIYVLQYVQQIYSGKTKHINIAMYITMLNSQRVVMTEIV